MEHLINVINRRRFIQGVSAGAAISAPLVKRGWAKNGPNEQINLAIVGLHGRGKDHISHEGYWTHRGDNQEADPQYSRESKEKWNAEPHFQNFIDCVRSRHRQDLNADVLQGHLSTTIAHLGNIAYRTNRKLHFDPETEQFVNDPDADTFLTRQNRAPYVVPDEV